MLLVTANHLKGPYDRGVEWPIVLVGVIAAVLLAAGLLPPYFELWKRGGRVMGISQKPLANTDVISGANTPSDWVFISIDWLGAFFSLMALGMLFHPKLENANES